MPLQVAIIGAVVGGLTLAEALQDNPSVNIQVYERATELKEIGALVGVGPNALRTLEKLELLSTDVYHNAPDRRHYSARMHRAKLQQALLKRIPQGIINLGKKVESVMAVRETGATVTFTDGTSIQADLVIGADGIKSVNPSASTSSRTISLLQIREIFDLYESTRRPHTSKVLAVVREGRAKSAQRLKEAFAGKPESDADFLYRITQRVDPVWVNEHDVEATFVKVLENRAKGRIGSGEQPQSRL
ncbi:hypothetical protein BDV12DRAFT_195942 [Aspergillus spectabilis]